MRLSISQKRRFAVRVAIVLTIFTLSAKNIFSQQSHRDELNKLRREIKKLETKLKNRSARESKTLEYLEDVDRKISLTKNIILRYKAEIEDQQFRVDSLEVTLAQSEKRLQELQKSYALRIASMYKRGRISTLELLLSARSFNQVKIWAEYQQRLAENDARVIRNIRLEKGRALEARDQLKTALQKQESLLAEKQAEERSLEKDRSAKKALVRKLRQDKSLYRRQIADYQAAIQEIQRLIAEAEKKRTREPEVEKAPVDAVVPVQNFASLQGRLPWPVQGQIIRRYGPYKHPVLKTITDNLGIDIKVPVGTEVHAVAAGKVTAITWQRGRGNLVIVNHGGGYYTVYTHLDEIYVQLQQDVVAGQTIGAVGEAGSSETPVLHFQVWNKFEHLNPENWLQ